MKLILLFIFCFALQVSFSKEPDKWLYSNEEAGVKDSLVAKEFFQKNYYSLFDSILIKKKKLDFFVDSIDSFEIKSFLNYSIAFIQRKSFSIGEIIHLSVCNESEWNEDLGFHVYYSKSFGIIYIWKAHYSSFGPRESYKKIFSNHKNGIDLKGVQNELIRSEGFYTE